MNFEDFFSKAADAYSAVSATPMKRVYRHKTRSPMEEIKRNRRAITWNTGETKCRQWTIDTVVAAGAVDVTYLTNLLQGDDHDERNGRRIRIMGYSYTLHGNDRNLDIFIIKARDNTAIAYAGFDAVPEGGIKWDEHNEWKVIQNVKSYNTNTDHYKGSKRFKAGLLIHYTGTAENNVAGPSLHLVAKNATESGIALTGTIYVFYKDA
jgi:hypothetical protein